MFMKLIRTIVELNVNSITQSKYFCIIINHSSTSTLTVSAKPVKTFHPGAYNSTSIFETKYNELDVYYNKTRYFYSLKFRPVETSKGEWHYNNFSKVTSKLPWINSIRGAECFNISFKLINITSIRNCLWC